MLQAAIIDDEQNVIDTISIMLKELCPDVQVVGTAGSIASAKALIEEKSPELIFLDIEMPYGTGFDLLESLPEINFDVIFVTAYNEYAIKAIRYSAVDYLLKPVQSKELISAVKKVNENREKNKSYRNYEILLENIKTALPSKLAIPTRDGLEFIEPSNIIRVEGDRSYSNIFLTNNRKMMVSKTLGDFEELLDSNTFLRVHKSHLINLAHIRKYSRAEGGYLEMTDGSNVAISRTKREEIVKVIHKIGKRFE